VDENDEGKEEEEERRSEIVNAPTYVFPLFLFFFVRIGTKRKILRGHFINKNELCQTKSLM